MSQIPPLDQYFVVIVLVT